MCFLSPVFNFIYFIMIVYMVSNSLVIRALVRVLFFINFIYIEYQKLFLRVNLYVCRSYVILFFSNKKSADYINLRSFLFFYSAISNVQNYVVSAGSHVRDISPLPFHFQLTARHFLGTIPSLRTKDMHGR